MRVCACGGVVTWLGRLSPMEYMSRFSFKNGVATDADHMFSPALERGLGNGTYRLSVWYRTISQTRPE